MNHLARRIYTASMSAVVQRILKGPNADGHQRKVFRTLSFIIYAVYLFYPILSSKRNKLIFLPGR